MTYFIFMLLARNFKKVKMCCHFENQIITQRLSNVTGYDTFLSHYEVVYIARY